MYLSNNINDNIIIGICINSLSWFMDNNTNVNIINTIIDSLLIFTLFSNISSISLAIKKQNNGINAIKHFSFI